LQSKWWADLILWDSHFVRVQSSLWPITSGI
jgi:hypothetical protein